MAGGGTGYESARSRTKITRLLTRSTIQMRAEDEGRVQQYGL